MDFAITIISLIHVNSHVVSTIWTDDTHLSHCHHCHCSKQVPTTQLYDNKIDFPLPQATHPLLGQ